MYKTHIDEFLQLITEFEDIWDGYLDRIKTAEHQIELTSSNTRPVYSALFRAGLTVRHLAAEEVQKKLREEVIGTANTK